MALSGSTLSTLIESNLTSAGFDGPELTTFCEAIGNGIVTATSGILTYTTSDLGLPIGSGVGIGTGILGITSGNISTDIYDTGQGFWESEQTDGPGIKWQDFCDAVSDAVVSHFASASLNSVHTPVLDGIGTVVTYTGITIPAMTSAIVNAAPGGWASARFPELAEAVATGVVNEITGHTPVDIVTIGAGSAGGTPGTGTGVVT